ncbi:MAG TPA: hypothetical protein VFQ61_22430 [Polyangiaceae bacterium]|nr:hypothetical protein [Polyangiaceae bacterium]
MSQAGTARGIALGLALTIIAQVSAARAEDKRACTAAYEEGQRLKQSGELSAAREKLLICGGAGCPSVMHADCERWLSEVEASLPTVVFEVESERDGALNAASVAIDGRAPVTLQGRALSFDPGEHEVRFLAEGHEPAVRHYFFSEGQKLRRESVTLRVLTSDGGGPSSEPPATSGESETTGSEPHSIAPVSSGDSRGSRFGVPFIIASSVAVAGAGGFVFFGLDARSRDRALGACEPNCAHGDIQATRDRYLYANVALGVGVASAVTAVILYLVKPGKSAASTRSRGSIASRPWPSGQSVSGFSEFGSSALLRF